MHAALLSSMEARERTQVYLSSILPSFKRRFDYFGADSAHFFCDAPDLLRGGSRWLLLGACPRREMVRAGVLTLAAFDTLRRRFLMYLTNRVLHPRLSAASVLA